MYNKVTLVGFLGRDPELKIMPSGDGVCSFTLATSEKWTGKDGVKKEVTQWHNIDVYGKQAEVCCKYLKKGRKCLVDGRITYRTYDDKATGLKRHITDIKADNVTFLDSPKEVVANETKQNNDDVPF